MNNSAATHRRSTSNATPGGPAGNIENSFCTVSMLARRRAEVSPKPGTATSPFRGSTVSVSRPAAPCYHRGEMSEPARQIRILTVDDHPMLREGVASVIEAQPDMVLVGEASNGREAIERFRQHRPDVTLMDLQMPDMNGIDAINAIRGEFPDARIVVLTTYKGDVQALRALKAGASGLSAQEHATQGTAGNDSRRARRSPTRTGGDRD